MSHSSPKLRTQPYPAPSFDFRALPIALYARTLTVRVSNISSLRTTQNTQLCAPIYVSIPHRAGRCDRPVVLSLADGVVYNVHTRARPVAL